MRQLARFCLLILSPLADLGNGSGDLVVIFGKQDISRADFTRKDVTLIAPDGLIHAARKWVTNTIVPWFDSRRNR